MLHMIKDKRRYRCTINITKNNISGVEVSPNWQNDSTRISQLSNKPDLNVDQYFEIMKLIQIQEHRLKHERYAKRAEINKALFKNKVCSQCRV